MMTASLLIFITWISFTITLPQQPYETSINSPHLTWSITDPSLIHNIITARNTHSFESPIFELNSFKWFIRISPNGRTREEYDAVMIGLVLATLPQNIHNITCKPVITLNETNTTYEFTKIVSYIQGESFRWGKSTLPTKTITKLSSLTITFHVNIIDIFDINGNNMTSTDINFPMQQTQATIPRNIIQFKYEWNLYHDLTKIKRAKTSHKSVWTSPKFGTAPAIMRYLSGVWNFGRMGILVRMARYYYLSILSVWKMRLDMFLLDINYV